MPLRFSVLNIDISNSFNEVHPQNIQYVCPTFEVMKLSNFIDVKDEQQ